jgi:hypothetical protein
MLLEEKCSTEDCDRRVAYGYKPNCLVCGVNKTIDLYVEKGWDIPTPLEHDAHWATILIQFEKRREFLRSLGMDY